LPAYLNSLTGQGVHIITVNELPGPPRLRVDDARSSRGWGISAGFIQSDMDPAARRKAYDCDITYAPTASLASDYLRDNMKPARWAIRSTPPGISSAEETDLRHSSTRWTIPRGRGPDAAHHLRPRLLATSNRFRVADRIARQLKKDTHFEVKEKEHSCHLTRMASTRPRSWPASRAFTPPATWSGPTSSTRRSRPTTCTSATSNMS